MGLFCRGATKYLRCHSECICEYLVWNTLGVLGVTKLPQILHVVLNALNGSLFVWAKVLYSCGWRKEAFITFANLSLPWGESLESCMFSIAFVGIIFQHIFFSYSAHHFFKFRIVGIFYRRLIAYLFCQRIGIFLQ